MSRLSIDGVDLECSVAGEGPPVLLLHGFTGTGATWSHQLPGLQQRHRTLVVDLLGHGASDAPSDPPRYEIERQAAGLAALLRALEAVPASIVGYSMGARLALMLAIEHGQLVDRLFLESPSAGIADDGARARRRAADDALAESIERDGVEAFVAGWEARPMFASHAALPEAVRDELRRQRRSQRAVGLAYSLRAAGQGAMAPLVDRLGEIRAPCLVVTGALDDRGRKRAAVVVAGITGATQEVVAAAGHTPHLEQPAEFDRLLADFLAPTASSAAARPPSPTARPPMPARSA